MKTANWKRIFVFVALAALIDRGLGLVLERLHARVVTGERGGLLNHALAHDAELLVLGSSRAQLHISPRVLGERLQLTGYNAGLKGHDVLYGMLLYDLWRQRHPAPKVLLLHVDIESLLERPNELAALQIFAPYLDESALVREVLYSAGPWKRLAYLSRAYRYNGKALAIAKNLNQQQPPDFLGYRASIGMPMTAEESRDPHNLRNALEPLGDPMDYAQRPFADRKVGYLRDLAQRCRREGTRLFLVHTPRLHQEVAAHRLWLDRLHTLLPTLPGVGFIEVSESTHHEVFSGRPDLYTDVNHLTGQGSEMLSRILADELAGRLGSGGGSAEPGGGPHPTSPTTGTRLD